MVVVILYVGGSCIVWMVFWQWCGGLFGFLVYFEIVCFGNIL